MSTTTIRLPEELKARVAQVARRSGKTAHGFILDAILEKTEADERRSEFLDVAEQRYAQVLKSGKAIPWQEMRGYLEGRLAGRKTKRLTARKLAR